MNKTIKLKKLVVGLTVLTSLVAPSLVSASSYTVKEGDTLLGIASRHQTSLEQLIQLNQIADANLIKLGQVLNLPDSSPQETIPSQSNLPSVTVLTEADQAAKEWIAQKESSGSYTAQNGQYYGRYQLSLSYLNGDLSPENQERVAEAYVKQRYGSWSAAQAFWLANGWY
ncbi:aggregation-promoting factor [Streptococcus cuniculipharyngis]|uniref:LysM peptidoglycan-binding domain-containing protein n=1 Tax=Streptococcus cuniculipharyngis TaxID=1562651 RepID=A0A5C5SCG3_9STRE|nr:LysM peptidoglycan-binding domain-containing protein [Streptococcus cuniculipharyngis]TWS97681.1 LysM peptidoglycan-binding domain-containing protein [Streptococcus cuniculipharyngis]